jgi:DNA (cytosine-5)-methyltransferase 1
VGNLTAADLFCGAGGISEGLRRAGYSIEYSVDNTKRCVETFRRNFDAEVEKRDVRELSAEDLPDNLDLLAGGPPCPTFSTVGRAQINSIDGRSSESDERHHLYRDFMALVEDSQPKAFLIENVPGMENADNENGEPVGEEIKERMKEAGYTVRMETHDAASFGVPQHRERLLIMGNRLNEQNPDLSEYETHREPKSEKEKQVQIIGTGRNRDDEQTGLDNYDLSERESRDFPVFETSTDRFPFNTIADAICDLPPVAPRGEMPPKECHEYKLPAVSVYQDWARDFDEDWEDAELLNHISRGHNLKDLNIYKLLGFGVPRKIGDLPSEFQPYRDDIFPDNYKRQDPLTPSSTIVAHIEKDGHMFIHPTEARSLTPREAARIQSFRDSYEFPEARSRAFRQIGNAVPPLLAQAAGKAMKDEVLGNV